MLGLQCKSMAAIYYRKINWLHQHHWLSHGFELPVFQNWFISSLGLISLVIDQLLWGVANVQLFVFIKTDSSKEQTKNKMQEWGK